MPVSSSEYENSITHLLRFCERVPYSNELKAGDVHCVVSEY